MYGKTTSKTNKPTLPIVPDEMEFADLFCSSSNIVVVYGNGKHMIQSLLPLPIVHDEIRLAQISWCVR